MNIFLILLCLALSTPASAEPSPEAVAASRLRQAQLPSLKQRLETARERYKAADAYFEGDLELAAAWPELEGVPLLSGPYVQGRLVRLQARDEARVTERLTLPDPALREADARLWRKTLEATLDAEGAADQRERQLWTSLSLGLRLAPELRDEALDAQIAGWRAAVAALPAPDEPGFAAAATAAASAGELEAVLMRYRLAAIRAMTIPGDLSLVRLATVDLLRQEDASRSPMEAEAAVDRLRRVAPLLPEAQAAAVQQAVNARELARLEAQLARLRGSIQEATQALLGAADPPAAPRATLEAEAAAQQRALETLQDETAAVLMAPEPPASDVLARRQREVAAARLELAELRASLAAHRLSLVPPEEVHSAEEGALRTQAQVDDAQRKAEEARRKAQEAGKERLQTLVEKLSRLSGQVAVAETQRQEQALATIQQIQEGQIARTQAIADAENAPPALRREAMRVAYVEQLRWMTTLRDAQRAREADVSRLTRDNARIRRDEIPPEDELVSAADAVPELVRSVQDSIDAILRALTERRSQALREQDQATRLLIAAQAQKRDLRERLSVSARASAEREAEVDPVVRAADELLDVPLVFSQRYRQMRDTDSWSLRGIFRQLASFIMRSIEIVILLIGWYVLRQNATRWLEQGLRLAQQLAPRARGLERLRLQQLFSADLSGLMQRLAPVIPPGADALVSLMIHRLIFHSSPLLGLLTLLWLTRAALRLIRPLVDLLVVSEPTPLALLHARPETRECIHRTVLMLTRFWLVATVLHYATYEVLRTDFLSERISGVLAIALVVLVAREVLRWAPTIRTAVTARGGDSRLVRWMTEVPSSSLVILLRAVVGVGYLLSLLLSHGATFLVEGRGGLGWIGSLIAQHSLKEIDQTCLPIPEDARTAIRRAENDGVLHLAEVAQIQAHYASWCQDQRRGMIALIGDRGSGKGRVLQRLADIGAAESRPTIHLVPPERTVEQADFLGWLAAGFGLPPQAGESWASLRQALLTLPGHVVLIDDTHRLLLRAVGGFTAMRESLDLMHATADRHFWICAFHGPTWSFLEGTAVPINLEVFRARVRLQPLEPATLSNWVTQATQDAGYTVRFDNLATAGMRSTDLIRIESAFWRRLNDISQGNPQVAFEYWLDSLRLPALSAPAPELAPLLADEAALTDPGVGAAGHEASPTAVPVSVLDVALLEVPDPSRVEGLPDMDLFVMTAILIHDGLSVDMLARSLNMPGGQVRASCRYLEGIGVLRRDRGVYRIQVIWRPAATRLLRQKHFLHNQR